MRTTSRRKASRKSALAPVEEPKPTTRADVSDPSADHLAQEDASPKPRIGLPLDADDRIDVDAMRSTTRERLKRALQDPTLSERLGIASTVDREGLKIPLQFFEQAAEIIFGTVDKLLMVAVLKQGYPLDQAQTLVRTDSDRAVLNPLAAQALNDWCPVIEGKYQSLALLGAGLFSVYTPKFAALKKPGTVHPFPKQQEQREQPQQQEIREP